MKKILTPGKVKLDDLVKIFDEDVKIEIDISSKDKVDKASQIVERIVNSGTPTYGINTGFGKLADKKIEFNDTKILQRNLILSHCSGVGDPLDKKTTRIIRNKCFCKAD